MTWPLWTKAEAAAYRHAKRYPPDPLPPYLPGWYKYAVTIIPGRFYFARTAEVDPSTLPYGRLMLEIVSLRSPASQQPQQSKTSMSPVFGVLDAGSEGFHFTTDLALIYDGFCEDFGPLNLGQTYRFFELVEGLLKDTSRPIVYYTSSVRGKAENAAYLVGAYLVLMRNVKPAQAIIPLMAIGKLEPFRDATWRCATYELRLYICLEGLETAKNLGWFQYRTFDIAEYETYEKVANGDLNWIIPRKFLAFAGPERDGNRPEKFVPIFKAFGVTLVIRLNKKQYNKKTFTKCGINHVDLFFIDGSCPSLDIVRTFLQVCEQEKGAIAVHCKAGLGRTGTLLGCYAMKHYGFEPGQWIAWNRICRPGSVLGPQQHFLHYVYSEGWLQSLGSGGGGSSSADATPEIPVIASKKVVLPALALLPPVIEGEKSPTKMTDETLARGLSPKEVEVAEKGEHGQGERLVSVKNRATTGRSKGSPRSPDPSTTTSSAATGGGGGGGLSPVQSMKRLANYFSSRTSPVRTR